MTIAPATKTICANSTTTADWTHMSQELHNDDEGLHVIATSPVVRIEALGAGHEK